MRILEELQSEYNEEVKIYDLASKRYDRNIKAIEAEVILLARYKVGDTVITKQGRGIIRNIVSRKKYTNELYVGYSIGRITKAGFIHKTNDLYYSGYYHREEDISLVEEIT